MALGLYYYTTWTVGSVFFAVGLRLTNVLFYLAFPGSRESNDNSVICQLFRIADVLHLYVIVGPRVSFSSVHFKQQLLVTDVYNACCLLASLYI